jgi:membrane protein
MSVIEWLPKKLDKYQQRHNFISFLVAVMKKYGDDQAGTQAALITFYGFLSLFPLLLVFFTVISRLLNHYPHLQQRVITAVLQYFPIAASQLQHNIHSSHREGLSLIVEILIFIYGARGVAGSLQNACNHIWAIPPKERPGFPKNLLRSMGLIAAGGTGLVLTTTGLSYITAIGRDDLLVKLLLAVIAFVLNLGVFLTIFRFATSSSIKTSKLVLGAIVSAILWQVLQAFGSFLVLHEFRQASALYGIFALVLGLLFWFSIQAQFTLYAIEINVVRVKKLWPVSFLGQPLSAHKKA